MKKNILALLAVAVAIFAAADAQAGKDSCKCKDCKCSDCPKECSSGCR